MDRENRRERGDIKVEDLCVSYVTPKDPVEAVRNVSFSASAGEFVCVLGSSGCGKTTILNVLAGFLPPTSGEVLLDGVRITEPSPDRAMVFQKHALFPWKSVRENVEFGLKMSGMSSSERRSIAQEYIARVGLAGFEECYPTELSGGMEQRVGLARALAVNPTVLLMDEPFSALDYPTKCNLQNELLGIWSKERKTTIFVTHDVEEALYLADRVFVLDQGRFVNVYSNPFPRPREEALRDEPAFLEAKSYLKACYGNPKD